MSLEVPLINLEALPAEERHVAELIADGLDSLNTYVTQFGDALSLFRFRREQSSVQANQPRSELSIDKETINTSSWRFVAARDAAMSIYHFACAIEGIKACVHRCPTLKTAYNAQKSKAATKFFSKKFPNYEKMRHAIAHAAELFDTPENHAKIYFQEVLTGGLA